jgi:flagellin
MKELAAQSAADAVDNTSRARIDKEFQQLKQEIDRVTATTEFQGSKLLQGTYGAATTTDLAAAEGTIASNGNAQTVTFAAGTNTITATSGTGISQTLNYATATAETLNFSALGITVAKTTLASIANINGKVLSTVAGSGTFLIGAARNAGSYSSAASNTLVITGSSLDLQTSTLTTTGDVLSLANAQAALLTIDTAIGKVSDALGVIGAGQNRLQNAIDNVKSTVLNYQAAESAIRDVDMANEMVTYSKNQILAQAGQAMLQSQNQSAAGVARMLQNIG